MAKVVSNPMEKMRMNIELADNGIIVRNLDSEDDVTLALEKIVDFSSDHSDEFRLIGEKIYSWLTDVVILAHKDELIITDFDIDIVATCKGREI